MVCNGIYLWDNLWDNLWVHRKWVHLREKWREVKEWRGRVRNHAPTSLVSCNQEWLGCMWGHILPLLSKWDGSVVVARYVRMLCINVMSWLQRSQIGFHTSCFHLLGKQSSTFFVSLLTFWLVPSQFSNYFFCNASAIIGFTACNWHCSSHGILFIPSDRQL